MAPTEAFQDPVTRIRPPKGWWHFDFEEIWRYRELLFFFCWRDFKVRYKQTLLGFSWALIGPVAQTIVFTLIFGRLANLPTDGLPQPVFYMAGLVLWRYFSQSLTLCSQSLVGGANLLTKIYFPRILMPLSATITNLIDLAISFAAFLVLVLYFNTWPAATSFLLPLFVAMALFSAFGTGLFFASLNVRYRDVKSLVPFVVQLWMYVSVIVPFSRFAEWAEYHGLGAFKYIYGLNPMACAIEGFRWCLFSHLDGVNIQSPLPLMVYGVPVTLLMVTVGWLYFKRVENQFADIV